MRGVFAEGLPPVSFFRSLASRIVASSSVVDSEGKSRDDYQQDLVEFALRFRGTGADPKLVQKSVRRRAIQAWQMRVRRSNLRERFPFPTEIEQADRAARDLENGSCVRLLERRLSQRSRGALRANSMFGTKVGAQVTGLSLPTFKRAVQLAQSEMRTILEGSMSTQQQQTMTDDELRATVSCYGYMFNKDEAECQRCAVRDRCIGVIVRETLPLLRQQGKQTVDAIVDELGTNKSSVTDVLFQIEKGKPFSAVLPPQQNGVSPMASAPPVPTTIPPPAAKVPAKKKGNAVVETKPAEKIEEPTPQVETAPKKGTKKKAEPKVAEPSPQQEGAADEPKTTKEEPMKAVGVKGKKKALSKKKKAEPKTTKTRANPKTVAARVDKVKPPAFDAAAFNAKWEAERARSPAVAALQPGAKLQKTYRGVDVSVTYRKGYVEWGDGKWPTLSQVKTAVVGLKEYPAQGDKSGQRKMTDWSVPRFFLLGAKKKPIVKKEAKPVVEKKAPPAKKPAPKAKSAKKEKKPAKKKKPAPKAKKKTA